MEKSKKGFTVLELITCIAFLAIFVVLFFIQYQNIEAMQRDEQRKVAINAMYYSLEEGYYEEHGYYPEKISSAEDLPWMDPNLLSDPSGVNIWVIGGDYSYESSNCDDDGHCKEYTLRAILEQESEYVKSNRN